MRQNSIWNERALILFASATDNPAPYLDTLDSGWGMTSGSVKGGQPILGNTVIDRIVSSELSSNDIMCFLRLAMLSSTVLKCALNAPETNQRTWKSVSVWDMLSENAHDFKQDRSKHMLLSRLDFMATKAGQLVFCFCKEILRELSAVR